MSSSPLKQAWFIRDSTAAFQLFSVLPQINRLGQEEESHRKDPWGEGTGTNLNIIRVINI